MSIHPNAVHWKPAMPNQNGAVTGFDSEIGHTWKLFDGWRSEGAGESFGPFKSERDAREALVNFINSGFVR